MSIEVATRFARGGLVGDDVRRARLERVANPSGKVGEAQFVASSCKNSQTTSHLAFARPRFRTRYRLPELNYRSVRGSEMQLQGFVVVRRYCTGQQAAFAKPRANKCLNWNCQRTD